MTLITRDFFLMIKRFGLLGLILFSFSAIHAQSYHALNGSPYAGVTSMYVNPASTVNSFYKWDATLIGIQFKTDQNLGYVKNSSVSDAENLTDTSGAPNNGMFRRHYHGVLDGQGFSFRYRINDKTAVALSFRGRTYNQFQTNNLFFHDSITSLNGFLKENLPGHTIDFYGNHAGWFETNLNVSRVFVENSTSKLSVGLNVGFTKALSGTSFSLRNINYVQLTNPSDNKAYYQANAGSLSYLLSSNVAYFDTVKLNSTSFMEFYKNSYSSINFSLGVEYMVIDETVEADINNRNYTWKFGAAIMDLGSLKYDYIKGSATNRIPNTNFVDTSIESRFSNVKTLAQFRNKVSPMFDNTDTLKGSFTVGTPARIVASVDRRFTQTLSANFQASINVVSTNSTNSINTRELNLFTLTPRWETQGFGFYLPIQYNNEKNLWVGAAIKIGPLLLGIHDFSVLGWFKKKDQTFNSGGYVMLNVYPYKKKNLDGSIKCRVL